ncbi:hypothetical protein BD410DRAFT_786303 [Rickenella mellea]|uniref:DUF1279 domain-containing protein n=1 Tax=Rickenella mellea TaxID=50990 RepID=A0A4Y7QA13_9AGAM|nr:hypothetical protein BD410DRAFT_786303 [Rickenella mellea]
MSRGLIPRLPFLRSFVRISAISRPILPLTRGFSTSPTPLKLTSNPSRSVQPRLFRNFRARFSTSPSPPQSPNSPGPDASITQRLRHLIKSYGWYALGVYAILGVLDFGVAFAGINLLGAEQVSRVEQAIKQHFISLIYTTPPEPGKEEIEKAPQGGREGLYAMIVLAWTVHKTLFLPIRVGLTAAVTPKLVGWLRMRGWAGRQGTMNAAREMRERVRRSRDRD